MLKKLPRSQRMSLSHKVYVTPCHPLVILYQKNKFRAQMPLHVYLYIVRHKWLTSMIPYSLSSLCDNEADWILRQQALSMLRLASMDTAAKTITSI